MKKIKVFFISLIALTFFSFGAGAVEAHPGRTASDGCHYCRTNCDRWGVPWNERHCHGGKKAPVVIPKYSPTPKPRKPSIYTPKPLPTAFPQSKVLGTENKNEDGNTWIGLMILALIAGGLYLGFRKIKNSTGRDKIN